MKRVFAILLAAAMLLGLLGCQRPNSNTQNPNFEPSKQTETGNGIEFGYDEVIGTQVQWNAQYIRAGIWNGGVVFFPCVRIVQSLQELQDYYTVWHKVFDLERKEQVYVDTTIGFLDACDRYDEAFFEENYLIFVILEESSGSVRHQVAGVTQTEDKKLAISIDRKVPEVCTDDMAHWHIILELSRDALIEKSIDTILYMNGQLSVMEDKVIIPPKEGAFKEPPKGVLITPEGETPLQIGGYSWFCNLSNGLEEAIIADQVARPLPEETLTPVFLAREYVQTLQAPAPNGDAVRYFVYFVKLAWEEAPTSVTYTCWPDSVWQDDGVKEQWVNFSLGEQSFFAWEGGYVYEIVATWEDDGRGYHGTAYYYVYIIGEEANP